MQPFIALCKGLMAEGHKCKIASHGEYRSWVEGHGIAFEEVGGDPAELMQRKSACQDCPGLFIDIDSMYFTLVMIAHDFFTISFMKEAVGRFRGWLDDLLETTWKACQGADVLIESPSAIAGYHIAEALRIPYYRYAATVSHKWKWTDLSPALVLSPCRGQGLVPTLMLSQSQTTRWEEVTTTWYSFLPSPD